MLKSQAKGCLHTGCSQFPWEDETTNQECRQVYSRDVQQVRQSKQQNKAGLDRGVYLRTSDRLSPSNIMFATSILPHREVTGSIGQAESPVCPVQLLAGTNLSIAGLGPWAGAPASWPFLDSVYFISHILQPLNWASCYRLRPIPQCIMCVLTILSVAQYVVSLYPCTGTLLNPGSLVHQELRYLLQSCFQNSPWSALVPTVFLPGRRTLPSSLLNIWRFLKHLLADWMHAIFLAVRAQGA